MRHLLRARPPVRRAGRPASTGWAGALPGRSMLLLAMLLAVMLPGLTQGGLVRAQEAGAIGTLAQGVAVLPAGDLAWQAVRARADPLMSAPFAPRGLGFVIATTDSLLVADDSVTHVSLLAPGEGVFVPGGETQQRSSLTDTAVAYLGVELVPAAAAGTTTDNSTVLEPGAPFPSPGDARELSLLGGAVTSADAFLVPDTGQKNIILVTTGALAVNKPGSAPTTLLAGESATFSGDLELAGASGDLSNFVVAVIGEAVAVPAPVAATAPIPTAAAIATQGGVLLTGPTVTPTLAPEPAPGTPDPTAAAGNTDGASGGDGTLGSITVQSLVCPPGMTAERLLPDECTPTTEAFLATLAGDALPAPLILADATNTDGVYTWGDLPFGSYRLSQDILPAGATEYTIGGARVSGNPIAGYAIELTADEPHLTIEFYNLTPAP